MTNAATRLTAIGSAILTGSTVFVCTATRAWKITPKTAAKWAEAGEPLFRVKGESLYLRRGRSWDCIDFCSIRIA